MECSEAPPPRFSMHRRVRSWEHPHKRGPFNNNTQPFRQDVDGPLVIAIGDVRVQAELEQPVEYPWRPCQVQQGVAVYVLGPRKWDYAFKEQRQSGLAGSHDPFHVFGDDRRHTAVNQQCKSQRRQYLIDVLAVEQKKAVVVPGNGVGGALPDSF